MRSRAAVGILALTTALVLGACTSEPDYNYADVGFAQRMVPHHEQTLELTRMVENYVDLQQLAEEIRKTQVAEIRLMNGWLDDWDATSTPRSREIEGMVTDRQMQELERRQAPNYDPRGYEDTFEHLWLELMVEHHQGAATMAEREIRDGLDSDVMEVARDIATSQRSAINRMYEMLDELHHSRVQG